MFYPVSVINVQFEKCVLLCGLFIRTHIVSKQCLFSYGQTERFSNECRKTKTKVITLANHNRLKPRDEPIRYQSK